MGHFKEILRSLTFRYIAIYITAISAAVFVLMGAIYVYFSYASVAQLGREVLGELEQLQQVYHRSSLNGVEQYVAQQREQGGRFSYLISNGDGEKVSGDLPEATKYRELDDGWLGFELALQRGGKPVEVEFIGHPQPLGDGYSIMVASNYDDIIDRAQLVLQTLFRVVLATVLLGIVGGYISAAYTLHRVQRLNSDISRIIRGDPQQRLNLEHEKGYVRGLGLVVNEMLEQMEVLMQGVRRVSDNIAHDLRTPLTRMRNGLSQLRDQGSPDQQTKVDSLISECDELLNSFNALLRISTLESGGGYTGDALVDLHALLEDVVELYEPLATEREIELSLACSGDARVVGDTDLLFQLFANLVDNAVKYTPASGDVALRVDHVTENHLDGVEVEIADNGPGIAAVERKNVFRRFYRVESSRSEHAGHGLGLSLVEAIARYHHGNVSLADHCPGLRVTVFLPTVESVSASR